MSVVKAGASLSDWLAEVLTLGVDILGADLKLFLGEDRGTKFVLAELCLGTCWAGTLCVKEGTVKSAARKWLDTLKIFMSTF